MRQPLRNQNPSRGNNLLSRSRPAPYKGWNARDPEAEMPEGYALSMINCFPTTADVALRPGMVAHAAPFPGLTPQVKALLSYNPANGPQKLFSSNNYGIYDTTTPGVPGAIVSTHSNGWVRAVNFRTTGSSNLVVVNGVESLRTFDGTTWATVASYTVNGGGTVLTSNINAVAVSNRRLFFTERVSLDAYALPVDSIGGLLELIPLGGVMSKGGSLHAVGTWTIDGGSGSNDHTVFVSTEGQVAVYSGTNPADAANWSLMGVYDLGEPLGYEPFIKYGGDLLYLSRSGLYPLSRAIQKTTVSPAISDVIREAFVKAAQRYGKNQGWCMAIDEPNSLLIVNIPITTLGLSIQYCMNLITKAWTQFQGWNAYSFTYHNGQLYAGFANQVSAVYRGNSDLGMGIIGTAKEAFSYLGQRSRNKHIQLLRPVIKVAGGASIEVALDMDFRNDAAFGPTNFISSSGGVWVPDGGSGSEWDVAVWADDAGIRLNWAAAAAPPGYAAALRLRMTSSQGTVSWSATDLLFSMAGHM